ncbi:MAG: hypothetical protein IKN16_04965 [Selenomonadaceae bacterium]|nr:hypothetical protein [Selenomonadaceae bacterium]MBR6887776.1 hypothetical protein [Selenomonadaceae bacterium]
MNDKQNREDKKLAEEILKDEELDSVAGGSWGGQMNPSFLPDGIHGQTGPGYSPKFISPSQTNDTVYGGQLGPG